MLYVGIVVLFVPLVLSIVVTVLRGSEVVKGVRGQRGRTPKGWS